MTNSQFTTLLNAINDVRTEVTARLDAIDLRIRTVEIDQAKASAIRNANRDAGLALRWKLGIAVSAVGIVLSLAMKLLEVL
jgi:hypothetical protein